MSNRVFHWAQGLGATPLAVGVGPEEVARVLGAAYGSGCTYGRELWALKVQIAPPGQPAWLKPEWVAAVRDVLACGPGSFCCDTVSITTSGLETPDLLRAQAKRQGMGHDALPFVVADEDDGAAVASGGPATGLTTAKALAVLAPLRPHPHLGFHGAVAELGLGLLPRAARLSLHQDIRPKVDTPLCAGCGSCLAVCLYDAIKIQAGRAFIDHQHCTGCGECMTVCFMAGIAPEERAGVVHFQQKVARAAVANLSGFTRQRIFINFLLGLDRFSAGPGKKMALELHQSQLLAGLDPVALDQATWDVLRQACGGNLKNWHGYQEEPETLLATAEQLGLGSRKYQLCSP